MEFADGDKPPVTFQRTSANRKLSPVELVPANPRPRPVAQGPFVSSTYASIKATCPDTCEWKGNGCYAETGRGYNPVRALEQRAEEWNWGGLETITAECDLIDGSFPRGVPRDGWDGRGRDLRLHISGDTSCVTGTKMLSHAAGRWRDRGGGTVWVYTHRWREIPRSAWGPNISPLASVEQVDQIDEAEALGYASAMTVVAHPDDRAFIIPGTRFKLLPCPAQTRGITCIQCRQCFDDAKLRRRGLVIGFAMHGRDATKAKKHLRVLQGGALDAVPLRLQTQR